LAILKNDIQLIQKLLNHNANPFKGNSDGVIPFVQGLVGASSLTMNVLLDNFHGDLPLMDSTHQSSMLLALCYQSPEVISLLIKRGLKVCNNTNNSALLNHIVFRYRQFGSFDELKCMLSCSPGVEEEIMRNFMENKSELNLNWQQGLASCVESEGSAKALLETLYTLKLPMEQTKELISLCLSRINDQTSKDHFFSKLVEERWKEPQNMQWIALYLEQEAGRIHQVECISFHLKMLLKIGDHELVNLFFDHESLRLQAVHPTRNQHLFSILIQTICREPKKLSTIKKFDELLVLCLMHGANPLAIQSSNFIPLKLVKEIKERKLSLKLTSLLKKYCDPVKLAEFERNEREKQQKYKRNKAIFLDGM
jgi:hypothetical protein